MLTEGVIFCTISFIMYVRSAVTEECKWAESPPRRKPLTLLGETKQIISSLRATSQFIYFSPYCHGLCVSVGKDFWTQSIAEE